MTGFIGTPSMRDIEELRRENKELREAVLAMAVALGAALPMTPDVSRTLSALADAG